MQKGCGDQSMRDGQISLPVGESQDSFVLENGDYYTQKVYSLTSFLLLPCRLGLGFGAGSFCK